MTSRPRLGLSPRAALALGLAVSTADGLIIGIPRYQANVIRARARLLSIRYLVAINSQLRER